MANDNQSQNDKPKTKPPPRRATKDLKESLLKDGWFLWSVFWRIGLAVVFVAGTIIGIIGYSVKDFIKDSEDRIKKEIDTTEISLSNRVVASSVQISNLVLKTFESSNVTVIVQNVAAERANNILETQVAPAVARFTNEIAVFSQRIEGQQGKIDDLNASLLKAHETESNLVTLIDAANTALKQLRENSEFISTVVSADHDDRKALNKLKEWMQQPSSPFRDAAISVFLGIQTELYKPQTAWHALPWSDIAPMTNQATWGMEQINLAWRNLPSLLSFEYPEFVWGHTNITKEQKLSFLRNAYLNDTCNSIRTANKAAQIIAAELNVKYNPPMKFEPLEKAWKAFVATNRLFAASTNTTTNTIYELFLASDTNRVQVIRDWNDTKLFSFKTDFVPKDGSLNSLFFHSESNFIGPIDKDEIRRFKNVCWATFGAMSTNTVLKVELKYEKDTSIPPIQSMEVTTNSIVFDRTNTFTIPPP